MLRDEEHCDWGGGGLQGGAQVLAGQAESEGEDGTGDQLAQEPQAPVRRQDVLLF